MEVAQKKSVWNFTLFIIYIRLAGCQVTLTHNNASALADTFICGTNTQFTCTIDPAPGLMSWVKDSATLTECAGAIDTCVDATVDNYQFTSNVAVNEFYLTVNPVMFSNAGTFTCSNGASVDDSKTINIAAVPSAITMTQESGTGNITLQATTDCAFPISDVSIKWYYLKELTDTPMLYTGFSPDRTEDSSTCTSGDCTSGVGVSKVVSTVTFDEKESGGTSAFLQAKMVHKAAPSSDPAVVATTTNKYIIIEEEPPEKSTEAVVVYLAVGVVGGGGAAVGGGAVYYIWFSSAVWFVVLTYNGIWILGVSIGVCVIKRVTPGGPADGKLKVGFQIHKIDGKSLTGKDQNEIEAMIKDTKILTLHVSKVGSTDTSEVKLNCKRGEQLGFDCENLAIVTAVTEGGKAYKKLKKGDHILSINGKSTIGKSIGDMNKQLTNPPTVMELTIKRGEDKKHVTLDFKGKASSGIAFKKEKEDIVVSAIEPESAAAISGEIQEKDCILSVNGVSTAGLKVADIKKMLTFSIILKVTKDVTVLELDLYLNGSIGVKNASANTVISVKAKGPATFAGIQEWDEILEIDGQSTDTMTVKQIAEMISSRGKTVRFKIARGEVTVERDEFGSLGLELSSTPNVVNKVYGNAALSQKVKVGDEILEIDDRSTDTMTVNQIAEMISSRGKTVRFKIARGEVTVERDTNGSLGLELSSTPNVVYKVDGNAALSQKVKAGDTIVSINGKKTKGKNHHEIKTMLESSGDSISLKIEEAVNENGKPHRTSGHGEHGARTNDIEMGHVNSRAPDSGRVQTLETTEEKQDFMKPLLDDKC